MVGSQALLQVQDDGTFSSRINQIQKAASRLRIEKNFCFSPSALRPHLLAAKAAKGPGPGKYMGHEAACDSSKICPSLSKPEHVEGLEVAWW